MLISARPLQGPRAPSAHPDRPSHPALASQAPVPSSTRHSDSPETQCQQPLLHRTLSSHAPTRPRVTAEGVAAQCAEHCQRQQTEGEAQGGRRPLHGAAVAPPASSWRTWTPWVVGRRGPPTPAPGPGPAVAERRRSAAQQPCQVSPTQPPKDPGPAHHAENTVCLAVQRLWQGWNVHTLRDSHSPAIQISDNHIQL